jgi:hypothetical protein
MAIPIFLFGCTPFFVWKTHGNIYSPTKVNSYSYRGIEPFFFCNPKYKKRKEKKITKHSMAEPRGWLDRPCVIGGGLGDGILLCYWQGECKWNDGLMMTDILQMTLMSAQKVS